MSSSSDKTSKALGILNTFKHVEQLIENIRNKSVDESHRDQLPIELNVSEESTLKRRAFLKSETGQPLNYLTGGQSFSELNSLEGNIENYIGMSMVPTGVIGPLRVIGSAANGDFFVPLATSEGALVASYHRGAKACYLAGGAASVCLVEGVQRSPVFKFSNMADLGIFVVWVLQQTAEFAAITAHSSRFAKFTDLSANIEGNHLILTFEYHTGDAAGQNMVTLCTDAICKFILENAPIKPVMWFFGKQLFGG
jgi:hydroxymethylglutaryl-CoA reductase (NADPH)